MATLRFKIEDGKVVDYDGRYFESISKDGLKAVGNGWEVTIRPATKKRPGRIIAHCERMYSDGLATCHREFRLEDGTLGLAGGNVYDRYAYFRKASFQQFLDEFGITAVKKEDPNQEFVGFAAYSGWGSAYISVKTDGQVESNYEDTPGSRDYFEAPGANPNLYTGHETYKVSGATWAIVETEEDYRDNHNFSRILYTQERDVTKLAAEFRQRRALKEAVARAEEMLNDKHFETAAQMRVVVEELTGVTFPLTLAEKPGEVVRDLGNWSRHRYNGIGFSILSPGNFEGSYDNLDEVGANINYRAFVKGSRIKLFANQTHIGDAQIAG